MLTMPIKFTLEILTPVVASSINWAEVCRKLGVPPMTGSQTNLKKRAKILGIDDSHFLGQASTRGRTFGSKRPIEDYLTGKATLNSSQLRDRLIKEGLKEKRCEICNLQDWLTNPIPLELDHINSNHFDNRLENLQIICPNCHHIKTLEERRKKKQPKEIKESKRIVKVKTPRVRKFEITKEELGSLVWSYPTKQVAKMFGVSDKAIEKRCKLLGVIKPPRGYWAKQQATKHIEVG